MKHAVYVSEIFYLKELKDTKINVKISSLIIKNNNLLEIHGNLKLIVNNSGSYNNKIFCQKYLMKAKAQIKKQHKF